MFISKPWPLNKCPSVISRFPLSSAWLFSSALCISLWSAQGVLRVCPKFFQSPVCAQIVPGVCQECALSCPELHWSHSIDLEQLIWHCCVGLWEGFKNPMHRIFFAKGVLSLPGWSKRPTFSGRLPSQVKVKECAYCCRCVEAHDYIKNSWRS